MISGVATDCDPGRAFSIFIVSANDSILRTDSSSKAWKTGACIKTTHISSGAIPSAFSVSALNRESLNLAHLPEVNLLDMDSILSKWGV